ncbi:MAG: hypothetical protein WCO52_05610 [bacterium]
MLHIDLNNILSEEDALQKISDIFTKVENEKVTYVLTKSGRPVLAIVDIDQLEQNFKTVGIDAPAAPVEMPAVQPTMPSLTASPSASMPTMSESTSPAAASAIISPTMAAPAPVAPPVPMAAPDPMAAPANPINAPWAEELPDETAPVAAPVVAPVAPAAPPVDPAAPAPATDPAAAVTPQAPPAGVPPINGSLELPEMPEDPTNSSPLA